MFFLRYGLTVPRDIRRLFKMRRDVVIPIREEAVQKILQTLTHQDLFIHLETTTGAYARNKAEVYLRNAVVRFSQGRIKGEGPYRIGLKMEYGWIYADGLTHWEWDDQKRLLMAGYDPEGKLTVALQLSRKPF